MLLTTGCVVAWMDVGDVDLNDPDVKESIRDLLFDDLRHRTVSELEREVGDTEQIALMCREVPAGLSDKLLKFVRRLGLCAIYKLDFTE